MTDDYTECLSIAQQELRLARKLLQTEISRYPAPISGCDAQFNQMLADRQRILETLTALEAQPFVPTPRQLNELSAVESR